MIKTDLRGCDRFSYDIERLSPELRQSFEDKFAALDYLLTDEESPLVNQGCAFKQCETDSISCSTHKLLESTIPVAYALNKAKLKGRLPDQDKIEHSMLIAKELRLQLDRHKTIQIAVHKSDHSEVKAWAEAVHNMVRTREVRDCPPSGFPVWKQEQMERGVTGPALAIKVAQAAMMDKDELKSLRRRFILSASKTEDKKAFTGDHGLRLK